MRTHHVLAAVLLLAGTTGCLDEDRWNADPCAVAYDRDGFIALVGGQYELSSWSVWPKNYRSKMPLDPDTVDCSVIRASLGFRGVQPVGTDSFAIAIARAFFHLPKNATVDRLDLELESMVDAVGTEQAHYLFDRALADTARGIPLSLSPVAESECVIVSEHVMTINLGFEQRPGLSITVRSPHASADMRALASSIKGRYDGRILEEGITELTIRIQVMQNSCSLCDGQVYTFFYVKENHNL